MKDEDGHMLETSLYRLHGKHLIAGEWVAGDTTFTSDPAHGASHCFTQGSSTLIDRAAKAAEEAFWSYGFSCRESRAAFLEAIADEIDRRADAITEIGASETGLPKARLEGERGRTINQLRLFATHILNDAYLDRRHDPALPDRAPLPRPDLKMVQRPIGPVAVFGASNFPLAFSVAGGDTASALAAGCPVVVKGHPAHPGTCEIIADAIHAALHTSDIHPGVFNLVQGSTHETGAALVQHPLIRAVGFTGSLGGGRALFDLCATRPDPIPFFGELGSVNPVFLLPKALKARGNDIAQGWISSLTLGAGQFCTNPGVLVAVDGPELDAFIASASALLERCEPQAMLTGAIAEAYRNGRNRIAKHADVDAHLTPDSGDRKASPSFFTTSGESWLTDETLGEEIFGPVGIIVKAADMGQLLEIANGLQGQLTCTLHLDAEDREAGQALLPILERKAGRLLANGFPTGVEVCDAMVHGGPYPASTNFGHTSVGTLSIRRFLRPVCYQDIPEALLPKDLMNV